MTHEDLLQSARDELADAREIRLDLKAKMEEARARYAEAKYHYGFMLGYVADLEREASAEPGNT